MVQAKWGILAEIIDLQKKTTNLHCQVSFTPRVYIYGLFCCLREQRRKHIYLIALEMSTKFHLSLNALSKSYELHNRSTIIFTKYEISYF